MITADCHTHTEFSSDSEAGVNSIIEEAIKKGLKTICITDHMDLLYPKMPEGDFTFVFDVDEYIRVLTERREYYKNRIKINIGIELGLRNEEDIKEEIFSRYSKLISKYEFDYIIGSTHVVRHTDPYFPMYWEGITKHQGIEEYFTAIYENIVSYDIIDSLGHMDYIVRYCPDNVREYKFNDYYEIIEIILRTIIDKGIALECNSAGLKYGLNDVHPKLEVLKRYREMGGELLTIGSDGHKPEHIAYDFNKVAEMLESIGFRYYTMYTGRKPEFIHL